MGDIQNLQRKFEICLENHNVGPLSLTEFENCVLGGHFAGYDAPAV